MEPFAWLILLMAVAIIAAYLYLKRRQAGPVDQDSGDGRAE
jgi:4-hydroxybenzoate polyprenyltransferase